MAKNIVFGKIILLSPCLFCKNNTTVYLIESISIPKYTIVCQMKKVRESSFFIFFSTMKIQICNIVEFSSIRKYVARLIRVKILHNESKQ